MKVKVHGDDVDVVLINMICGITPLSYENVTVKNVEDYLSSRCFGENKADAKEILRGLSVHEYDPLRISRKTFGRVPGDDIWLDFGGCKIRLTGMSVSLQTV